MEEYLLQNCTAGYVGSSPMFWREGGGYTHWIDEAKRWTKEDAESQIRATRGTHSWFMWSVADIESVAKRTVDFDDLMELKFAKMKNEGEAMIAGSYKVEIRLKDGSKITSEQRFGKWNDATKHGEERVKNGVAVGFWVSEVSDVELP